ncbi:MAG TPA: sigma-54 dependent transcriptional regulator [Vicinamibacterales bacterium]|nr:sigma-54 dependent transcriptional regulator [Vicinamibacterales bacterium]
MSDGKPAQAPRLLIVDDDPNVAPIVERFARPLGFVITYIDNGRDALERMPSLRPDVVMIDLQMPELSGIDVLKAMRAADAECQAILMTGNPSVDTAIEAVKAGALDYLSKPFDFDRLKERLLGVRDNISRREALMDVDADVAARLEFHGLIGRSAVMQELFALIQRVAPHARSVLVTGETGTGKELVARALHARGPRRSRKFITLNCSAVVETLFESELFGHVRGAFTGAADNKVGLLEHAHQGSVFLDEIGELPPALQPKLLRALEYGEIQRVGAVDSHKIDVNIVAATNRNLISERDDRFRRDLYYRLSVIEIHLPPLRERREDIPYLTAAFVRDLSNRFDRTIAGVSPAAERRLQEAPWPGNIRQLRNVIERACILTEGRLISERDLQSAMIGTAEAFTPAQPQRAASAAGADLLTTAQKEQVRRVLHETGGNKAAAAKRLGVSRRSLYRWLDRLDLTADN